MDRQTLRLLFVIAAFVLAGTYLFVLSEGGVLERLRLKKEIHAAFESNSFFKSEYEAFKDYNAGDWTPTHEDMINSGYVKTGDKILIIRDKVAPQAPRPESGTPEDSDSALTVYRILWMIIALSVFSVLYFFWRKSSTDDA